MSVFKVKWMTTPGAGHVYVRVFSSPSPNHTYAALGNLTMRKGEEWEAFQRAFSGAIYEEEHLEAST